MFRLPKGFRPLPGNLNAGNAYAFEWGDTAYVAVWGVYHGMPTNDGTTDPAGKKINVYGTAPPQIMVTFTIRTGTGRTSAITTVANLVGSNPDTTVSPYGWINNTLEGAKSNPKVPADLWIDDPAAPHNDAYLHIWGIDPNDLNDVNVQNSMPKQKNLTASANGNIFPWIAILKNGTLDGHLILPDANHPYTPGESGISIMASAHIMQNLTTVTRDQNGNPTGSSTATVSNAFTPAFRVGESDPDGLHDGPEQDGKNVRNLYIAHPLALTVRGPGNGVRTKNQTTGITTGPPNLIGWDVTPFDEMLGNGNRAVQPLAFISPRRAPVAALKTVFAPMGSLDQNNSGTYLGVQNGGLVQAFFVEDRSNYTHGSGRRLPIKGAITPLSWYGGPTSVMNPLPWEQLPRDGFGSDDYPNLDSDNVQITLGGSGQDIFNAPESDPPTLDPPTGFGRNRTLNPMPLNMTVHVPKYFPANMNWGIQGSQGIGSPYKDPVSGTILGDGSNTVVPDLMGPLDIGSGTPLAANQPLASPSGGFIGNLVVRVAGTFLLANNVNPQQTLLDLGQITATSASQVPAYRAATVGTCVLPAVSMQIVESTIDLGKKPHGGGYSDVPNFDPQVPFAPLGTRWYPAGTVNPWDNDAHDGYFHPFTIVSESNINLVDIRLAKLYGDSSAIGPQSLRNPAPAGMAQALPVTSGNVDAFGLNPPFSIGFPGVNGGVGNIGIVSNLDHYSLNNLFGGAGRQFREIPMFPVANPFVDQSSVYAWNSSVTSAGPLVPNELIPRFGIGNNGVGEYLWQPGSQPQPTIHKPRPGDGQGVTMSIPDGPHGSSISQLPLVGMAVPLGTPAGTYSAYIRAFEDSTPFQMRVWDAYKGINAPLGSDHDAVLNQTLTRNGNQITSVSSLEGVTEPGTLLKITVTESRLTSDATRGSLANIDPLPGTTAANMLTISLGANMQPAAFMVPSNPPKIELYMATNRQPAGGAFLDPTTKQPAVNAPWQLAYTTLTLPYSNALNFFDASFGVHDPKPYSTDERWWEPLATFPPSAPATMFPSTPGTQVNGILVPSLTGTPIAATERHGSPAIASNGNEAYLFWQGAIDKVRSGLQAAANGLQNTQITDSRTFWQKLVNGVPSGPIYSFLNDPSLTKINPKPLLVNLASGGKALFLFWHTGTRGQTALYYNVNVTSGTDFAGNGWSQDTRLPTPGGLSWESDACPIARTAALIHDPDGVAADATLSCIDVVYTGLLKNRSNPETLLSRYILDISTGTPVLKVVPLAQSVNEPMARIGSTNTYEARDAAWYLGTVKQTVTLYYGSPGNPTFINTGLGRLDAASGLVYYNSNLGGQIVVDIRTGRISFPNVPLPKGQRLFVTYTPQVMRLSVGRSPNPNITDNSPVESISASTHNPFALLDTSFNPRAANTPVDRLWVLYRKDSSGDNKAVSGVYYKPMRLMVQLPASTTGAYGNITSTVTPAEIDYDRGRVYFTEADEGKTVTVTGGGQSVSATIRWCDELATDTTINTKNGILHEYASIPDTLLPTEVSGSAEGQVTAFKDPYQNKLWVFWNSTRNGTIDLYYETIAPLLYPLK